MLSLITCAIISVLVAISASTGGEAASLEQGAVTTLETEGISDAEALARGAKSKQEVLNKVIDDVLVMNNMEYHGNGPDLSKERAGSSITGICGGLPEKEKSAGDMDKAGCHAPKDSRHMYNVKIEGHKFILFADSRPIGESTTLPHLRSVIRRVGVKARGETEVRPSNGSLMCPNGVFRGTLHVLGIQTTTNVYHTISDNYVPAVSQLLLDAYSQSPYLKLPRVAVLHRSPIESSKNDHAYLQRSLFSAGVKAWEALDGLCFGRVVWGWGPHTNYFFHMLRQRRMASDFARLHVSALFPMDMPKAWSTEERKNSKRAVLFTRGSSGKGRSMAREELILEALRKEGILAETCCDFRASNSLQMQLQMAYHADIVLGLHGAGLTHSIFSKKGIIVLELKTIYAFNSVLMAMIADSREGVHIQVDVRSYFVVGGHKPVDEPLVLSVVEALETANKLGLGSNQTGPVSLTMPVTGIYASCPPAESKAQRGILITRHTSPSPAMSHFLGPIREDLAKECEAIEVATLSKTLGGHPEEQCVFEREYIPNEGIGFATTLDRFPKHA